MNRVLLFGISGATWQQIDPLLSKGKLPTLRRLIERGCRATLKSARVEGDKHFRPQIAWPTIATGVDPARHGITRFYHTASDLVSPTLWERLQQHGARVGLLGWPITWPVKPVNGFLVPGYDGRDLSTWPQQLSYLRTLDRRQIAASEGDQMKNQISARESAPLIVTLIRAGVTMHTFARLTGVAADMLFRAPRELRPLLMRHARLQISTDAFLKLCRQYQPHFAAFVTFLVDFASHRYWMFQEPQRFADTPPSIARRLSCAVADAYIAVDRVLDQMLRSLSQDTVVAIVSEHGMGAEEVSTEIGPWHYVLRPNRLKELVGINPNIPAVPVARWIAFRPPVDQQSAIAERLRSIGIAGTGLPLFQVYAHRDEVIVKLALYRDSLPNDLQNLEQLQARYQDRTVPFTTLAQRFGRRRSAMHAEDGILILHGPGIRRGVMIGQAHPVNVAPTLLRACLPTAALAEQASIGLDSPSLDVFENP